ncbi:MAG TPA: hypothetical protein VK034_00275 [Enhygromyxa sp.]|nr:hypothetical protein [Enhygromyxa sp.]
MLIAAIVGALAAVLVGMGGANVFDELLRYWRRAIRRRVDDPDRRAAGQAKLDEFEHEAAAMAADLRGWVQSFAEVHRRYASTPADYDQLADRLVEEFYPAQMRLVELADELRRAIGDSAYTEITDDVEKRLRAARERKLRREAKSTSR